VGADGNAEITYTYDDGEVVDDGSVSDATREQLEAALKPLTELRGYATLTPRNEYLDERVEGTESFPEVVVQILGQIGQGSSALAGDDGTRSQRNPRAPACRATRPARERGSARHEVARRRGRHEHR